MSTAQLLTSLFASRRGSSSLASSVFSLLYAAFSLCSFLAEFLGSVFSLMVAMCKFPSNIQWSRAGLELTQDARVSHPLSLHIQYRRIHVFQLFQCLSCQAAWLPCQYYKQEIQPTGPYVRAVIITCWHISNS